MESKFKLSNSIRKNILDLDRYIGGEQVSRRTIRLNANENPYKVPDIIIEDIKKELEKNELFLYPDESASGVRKSASKVFNLNPEQILLDNGSAAMLSLIFHTLLDKNDKVTVASPTFGLYEKYAKVNDAIYSKVEWDDNFTLPVEKLLAVDAKFIVVVNPNAPTGTVTPLDKIEKLLRKSNKIVLVDEAYGDFIDTSSIELLSKYDNLIVMKSFSKSQSLAGMRIGLCFSSVEIIEQLNKVRTPYNLNMLTQVTAKSVLDNWSIFEEPLEKIKEEREKSKVKFKELNFEIIDSNANFLLVKVPKNKIGAKDLYLKLKDNNILVRYLGEETKDYIRVSIGTSEDMNIFFKNLREIVNDG